MSLVFMSFRVNLLFKNSEPKELSCPESSQKSADFDDLFVSLSCAWGVFLHPLGGWTLAS